MKKEKPSVAYETCYKHKLNMLGPGMLMLKWTGLLFLIGFVLQLIRLKFVSYIVFGLAGTIFLVLVILLAIEAHQDNVLNEIAAQENKED